MQVYKAVLKIVSRRKMSMIIYSVIFLALTVMLTNTSVRTKETEFSQVAVKIAVANQDKGIFGEQLQKHLSVNHTIMEVPKDKDKLLDQMYYREIEYVLRIPEDFSEKFAAGERQELLEGTVIPGSNASSLVETDINQFIKTVGMYADSGSELEQALKLSEEDMKQHGTVSFLDESDSDQKEPAYYFFNFQAYVFLCVIIVGIGPVMIIFKRKEIDARNKCSAKSFGSRNLQIIFGSMTILFLLFLLFMGVGCILYPAYMFSIKGLFSAVNSLLFMLLSLSITFLAGQFVQDENALNMIGNVLGLGFSFLGGVFVSLDIMGEGIKQVSKFVPSYWYVAANEAIQSNSVLENREVIFQSYLIILGFTAAVLAVGMLVNRMRAKNG